MDRSAPRTARIFAVLACAAVPVMLAAGCSSGSTDRHRPVGRTESAGATPSLAPAKFAELPAACTAVAQDTVKRVVPKAKDAVGKSADSTDPTTRSGCSWNGLDGYQYRWLDVTLQRFDSVAGLGTGDEQAAKRYTEQVTEATAQAKGATTVKADGLGDTATVVSALAKRNDGEYQNETVVVRTANVVVIVAYNGAGFQDAKTPSADDMRKNAVAAAKDAVASVPAANS